LRQSRAVGSRIGDRAGGGRPSGPLQCPPACPSLTTTSLVVWRALTWPYGSPTPRAIPGPRVRASGCARAVMVGAAHWGSRALRGRLGTCHRTRSPRPARAASTDAPAGAWPPVRRPRCTDPPAQRVPGDVPTCIRQGTTRSIEHRAPGTEVAPWRAVSNSITPKPSILSHASVPARRVREYVIAICPRSGHPEELHPCRTPE